MYSAKRLTFVSTQAYISSKWMFSLYTAQLASQSELLHTHAAEILPLERF